MRCTVLHKCRLLLRLPLLDVFARLTSLALPWRCASSRPPRTLSRRSSKIPRALLSSRSRGSTPTPFTAVAKLATPFTRPGNGSSLLSRSRSAQPSGSLTPLLRSDPPLSPPSPLPPPLRVWSLLGPAMRSLLPQPEASSRFAVALVIK